MSHSVAVIVTAALVAALLAGGAAFAVNALTKHDAKQLFYTKKKSDKKFAKSSESVKKSDADKQYVRTGSSASASLAASVDLGPTYQDLASTTLTTNGGRVLATANVNLRDTTANINHVECTMKVDATEIDHWIGTVQDATGSDRVVYTLVGATGDLAAGSHTVSVRCGEAAAIAGVTSRSAYMLRNKAGGESFARAWDAALSLAATRLAAIAFDRALHGRSERFYKDGELVMERKMPSDYLLTWLMARLDPVQFGSPSAQALAAATGDPRERARQSLPDLIASLTSVPDEDCPVETADYLDERLGEVS